MTPEQYLSSGDPEGALAALQAEVRAKPQDAKLRIFLFQLLCVQGDWRRAITQLKLCAELDPSALPMAQTYREAIICEVFREKVFAGEKSPLVFGEPQEWIALQMEALKLLAHGDAPKAADLRELAFEAAPASSGTLNDVAFDWIADADTRLGPLLEMVVNGRYFWVPFTAIKEIRAEDPEDLRDCVWTAVNLVLNTGGEVVALIPTRYPGTAGRNDGRARLARLTEWADAGDGAFIGAGQRLLTTDSGDVGIMDLRRLAICGPTGGSPGG